MPQGFPALRFYQKLGITCGAERGSRQGLRVERRVLCLLSAAMLGLSAVSPFDPAAAQNGTPPEEAVQGHGKLGTAHLSGDAAFREPLEKRLAARGMKAGAPIMIRIFKSEAELELWMRVGGRFELLAVYPICNWAGTLGPKLSEGDKQSPEGLYSIGRRQLHRSARWRRSLDLGYPNAFDRGHARTGSYVLLHGGCTSTGCFAMTDPVIDEIFHLSRAALRRGQRRIQVHVFPFRMTETNLAAHADSYWQGFWTNLKEAYDLFESTRLPPSVRVCNRRYVVSEAGTSASCAAHASVSDAARHQAAQARRSADDPAVRHPSGHNAMQAQQRHAAQAEGQRRLPR